MEAKEVVDYENGLKKQVEDCRDRCIELEIRSNKAEERCDVLESEVQILAVEKIEIEEKVRVLKKRNDELEKQINGNMGRGVDLTCGNEEEDKVFRLMIENEVLECEKKKAESEVHIWKMKFEEMESLVLELEMKVRDIQPSGTPPIDVWCKQFTKVEGGERGFLSGTERENGKRARKQLSFEEGSRNKMAPSTPGGAKIASIGVIDISDSDDVPDYTMLHIPTLEIHKNKMVSVSAGCTLKDTLHEHESAFNNDLKSALVDQSDEEDMGCYNGSSPFASTPKRKRASNIVVTDSETDDDDDNDNVPISKLKTKRIPKLSSRLRSPSPSNFKTNETKCYPGIPTNEDVKDEMIEGGSDSDDESLGGFIVDSSVVSDSDGASGESEDASDCDMDFVEIISKIRRKRDHNLKWEFEADMLAAFGQDPELCMRAVCALYRQQTSEEQSSKETIFSNQRGFSHCDAHRGTTLAEFLSDGDPNGDLKKSVEELQVYNPKGLALCRKLATHYSKQLFQIYKNKEDPFFLPS